MDLVAITTVKRRALGALAGLCLQVIAQVSRIVRWALGATVQVCPVPTLNRLVAMWALAPSSQRNQNVYARVAVSGAMPAKMRLIAVLSMKARAKRTTSAPGVKIVDNGSGPSRYAFFGKGLVWLNWTSAVLSVRMRPWQNSEAILVPMTYAFQLKSVRSGGNQEAKILEYAMALTVRDAAGNIVALVDVAPDCPFAIHPGEPPGFVLGTFAPSPAMPHVKGMLDQFDASNTRDTFAAAVAMHEQLDVIGLTATDSAGRTYRVVNVHFQSGGLFFAALSA